MNEEFAKQIIELQNLSSLWSIGSSIASIVLAVVAIVLAVYFYTQSKKTEKEVSMSLSKIEAQSQALEKITGNQVERLTKHLTERDSLESISPNLQELLKNVSQKGITNNEQNNSNNDRLIAIKYMIGAYHYCAVSNYYAFMSLPAIENFDEENHFHQRTKGMLDTTSSDVNFIKNQFINLNVTDEEIEESGLSNLYKDTEEIWSKQVKDATQSFLQIEQYKKQDD
jgi:hypothetical protein